MNKATDRLRSESAGGFAFEGNRGGFPGRSPPVMAGLVPRLSGWKIPHIVQSAAGLEIGNDPRLCGPRFAMKD